MSATGFTGTLNNAYIIPQPTTGEPTGGNWINWTVNANTIQAIGPTGALTTAMSFNVGGTGYATLSATGFVLTNPPVNGDSSNKVATTAWVMSNAPGGVGGATLAANQTFTGANTFNQNLTVNSLTVGKGAGSGANNTAIGTSVLNANISGANNVAVGANALTLNTASQNTAVGSLALQANTSGTPNTALGYNALNANISGAHNVAVGANALTVNTASQNTAVGSLALQANTGGTPNTAVGYNALPLNNSGANNVAVGANAGGIVTSGTNNIYIGNNTNAFAAGVIGEVVIGNGITGAGTGTMTLGSNNTKFATLSSAGLVGVQSFQTVLLTSGSGTIGVNTTGQTYNYQGVKSIWVQMVGAGGGGGASGATITTNSQAGGNTQFGQVGATVYQANGGAAGVSITSGNPPAGAAGGTTSLGNVTGTVTVVNGRIINGGPSETSRAYVTNSVHPGGNGGLSPMFSVFQPKVASSSVLTNGYPGIGYGAGGGGGDGTPGQAYGASGGGGGAYIETFWSIPYNTAVTFSYLVGAANGTGATAVTSSTNGGAGTSGAILIIMYS